MNVGPGGMQGWSGAIHGAERWQGKRHEHCIGRKRSKYKEHECCSNEGYPKEYPDFKGKKSILEYIEPYKYHCELCPIECVWCREPMPMEQ